MTADDNDHRDLISNYVARVRAGLKGLDEHRQEEIAAEIRSHLTDRIEQLKHEGSLRAAEVAVTAMGEPEEISMLFMETAMVRSSANSNFPWVLLRGAAHLVFTGVRGALLFLAGLVGYGIAICFVAAAGAKLVLPNKVGFWAGPNTGVIWGYPGNTLRAHELAGNWFAYISIALAFLLASGTTLLLKQCLRTWRSDRALRPGPELSPTSVESR
jgi:uncharacterized membrane protein